MTTILRPMTTSELLDRTFNIYRNNFPLFAGIATAPGLAAIAAPLLMLSMGLPTFMAANQAVPDPRLLFQALIIYFLLFLLFYAIGFALATGATVYAVSKIHLGETVTITESCQKVVPLFGRILHIVSLVVLRVIGVVLAMYLVAGVAVAGLIFTASGGGLGRARGAGAALALTFFLLFTLILVGYFFAVRLYLKYSLAVPACMLEDTRAGASLKRSSVLTKGSLWKIFGIYFLTGLIGAALSFALHIPVFVMARFPQAALVWQFLATFIAYTLSFPISTIAISLVYYDQRVRKEAFDLQLMMDSVGQSGPGQAAAATPIG
jgi:hypothetical protein